MDGFGPYWKTGIVLLWLIVGGCRERGLVRPTPQMSAAERFWVRVLLLDEVSDCRLRVSSGFCVINGQTQRAEGWFGETSGPISISMSGGRVVVGGQVVRGAEVIILPDKPHIFELNGSSYRGKLKLVISADRGTFDAINLVPLEAYLAGVVGAEMPDYWEPAALEAQAVAARSYCLYIKKRFGGRRNWDVKPTAAHQVYQGVSAESAQVWGAVYKTFGEVLVCRHADGSEGTFPTYYSSTCGGYTENSKNVFGDSFEPLVGVRCPYCKDVAKPRFFFWATVQFDKAGVTRKLLRRYPKLKELGEITNIIAAKQSNYDGFSRLTSVKLLGSKGKSGFLRAEDLRLTIDPTGHKIRSTICQIKSRGNKWAFLSGRGYGHGVGMCQCGAQGMARKGKSARAILLYYYPGSKIVRLY